MFFSPLRYPGGKGKLGQWFMEIMRSNNISGGHYIEPYAGGSGVALYLLMKGIVNTIHINDYDKAVYLFWKFIVNEPENFIKRMYKEEVTLDRWKKNKKIIENQDSNEDFDIAFAFFFLNRTNRSGIVKGGVIGGIEQKGNYKIDARFNKDALATRIRKIAKFRDAIKITNKDAKVLLNELSEDKNKRSLIYLDPPYYQKGAGLYLNAYNDKDHTDVADEIKKLKIPWVLTYDNNERIKELYDWSKSYSKDIRYSAQVRRLEKELVYCGNISLKGLI